MGSTLWKKIYHTFKKIDANHQKTPLTLDNTVLLYVNKDNGYVKSIVFATSAYPDANRLHRFGQFNVF